MLNIKKICVLVLYILFVGFLVYPQTQTHEDRTFEFFTVSDKVKNAPKVVETVERFWLPVQFYFTNAVSSPFKFDVVLNPVPGKQKRSLWLYVSQNSDHGVLSFELNGSKIAEIDNRAAPHAGNLKYLNDIDVTGAPLVLNVTSQNDKASHHYAELGFFVLTPPGAPVEQIQEKIGQLGLVKHFDSGVLVLVLMATFFALAFHSRDITLNHYTFGPGGIHSAIILGIAGLICCYAYFHVDRPVLLHTTQTVTTQKNPAAFYIEDYIKQNITTQGNELKTYQANLLPSRIVRDTVPDQFKHIEGKLESQVFYQATTYNQPEVFDQLLGGFLKSVNMMSVDKVFAVVITLLNIIVSAIIISAFVRHQWFAAFVGLTAIILLSCFLSLRVSEGWDELFINVRQAEILQRYWIYGLNPRQWTEGTVELLPVIMSAASGMLGFCLIDGMIAASLLGMLVLIIASYCFVLKLTEHNGWALFSALIIGLYPNVLWGGATGFSSVLFCGLIVASAYTLIFTENKRIGLIFLAFLPFIRTEGIVFAALLLMYTHVVRPLFPSIMGRKLKDYVRSIFTDALFVILPFAALSGIRYYLFGHIFPLPLFFKNTGFDRDYAIAGVDRFIEMMFLHALPFVIITVLMFSVLYILGRMISKTQNFSHLGINLFMLNIIMFLFVVPYYYFFEGGDSLPVTLNRNGMPFNIVLVLSLFVLLYRVCFGVLRGWLRTASVIVFSAMLFVLHGYTGQFHGATYTENLINKAKNPYLVPWGGWGRINLFAFTGNFLDKVLPSNAVVASPEEASLMYFSKRDMLGLSGLTNPDVTFMPLQPKDFADSRFRRRATETLAKRHPDVVMFFEPVFLVNLTNPSQARHDIRTTLQQAVFEPGKIDLAFYHTGSMDYLKKLGYRHITVAYSNVLFSFFLQESVYDPFVQKLGTLGFKDIGRESVSYKVGPHLSENFLPSAKEILPDL